MSNSTSSAVFLTECVARTRNNIIKAAKISIKNIIETSCFQELECDSALITNFLTILEHALYFRIRGAAFLYDFPKSRHPWHLIATSVYSPSSSSASSSSSSITTITSSIASQLSAAIGKTAELCGGAGAPTLCLKVFLRLALMEKRLHDYLRTLLLGSHQQPVFSNKKKAKSGGRSIPAFYEADSIVRAGDEFDLLINSLLGLDALDFSFDLRQIISDWFAAPSSASLSPSSAANYNASQHWPITEGLLGGVLLPIDFSRLMRETRSELSRLDDEIEQMRDDWTASASSRGTATGQVGAACELEAGLEAGEELTADDAIAALPQESTDNPDAFYWKRNFLKVQAKNKMIAEQKGFLEEQDRKKSDRLERLEKDNVALIANLRRNESEVSRLQIQLTLLHEQYQRQLRVNLPAPDVGPALFGDPEDVSASGASSSAATTLTADETADAPLSDVTDDAPPHKQTSVAATKEDDANARQQENGESHSSGAPSNTAAENEPITRKVTSSLSIQSLVKLSRLAAPPSAPQANPQMRHKDHTDNGENAAKDDITNGRVMSGSAEVRRQRMGSRATSYVAPHDTHPSSPPPPTPRQIQKEEVAEEEDHHHRVEEDEFVYSDEVTLIDSGKCATEQPGNSKTLYHEVIEIGERIDWTHY